MDKEKKYSMDISLKKCYVENQVLWVWKYMRVSNFFIGFTFLGELSLLVFILENVGI